MLQLYVERSTGSLQLLEVDRKYLIGRHLAEVTTKVQLTCFKSPQVLIPFVPTFTFSQFVSSVSSGGGASGIAVVISCRTIFSPEEGAKDVLII